MIAFYLLWSGFSERSIRTQRSNWGGQSIAEDSREEPIVLKYEEYKETAQQKLEQEQAQTLEKALSYIGQERALYMTENKLQQLYKHIRFFQLPTEQECEQINSPVTVDAKLNSLGLMHFGWNVGNLFKKSGIETATFIKQIFATPFEKAETSTVKRKL